MPPGLLHLLPNGTRAPVAPCPLAPCPVARPPRVTRTFPLFFFSSVDCLDPTCSSHGVCVNGECLCSPGWGGLNCELARVQCPDQCSGHGTYLPDSGLCSCDPNWMGPDCSVGKPRGFLHGLPTLVPGVPSHPQMDGPLLLTLAGHGGTLANHTVPFSRLSLAAEFVVFVKQ